MEGALRRQETGGGGGQGLRVACPHGGGEGVETGVGVAVQDQFQGTAQPFGVHLGSADAGQPAFHLFGEGVQPRQLGHAGVLGGGLHRLRAGIAQGDHEVAAGGGVQLGIQVAAQQPGLAPDGHLRVGRHLPPQLGNRQAAQLRMVVPKDQRAVAAGEIQHLDLVALFIAVAEIVAAGPGVGLIQAQDPQQLGRSGAGVLGIAPQGGDIGVGNAAISACRRLKSDEAAVSAESSGERVPMGSSSRVSMGR